MVCPTSNITVTIFNTAWLLQVTVRTFLLRFHNVVHRDGSMFLVFGNVGKSDGTFVPFFLVTNLVYPAITLNHPLGGRVSF